MTHDPDPERLKELEERLGALKEKGQRNRSSMGDMRGGEMAWRMVIELVVGMGIGLAIGYGFDSVLGTKPVLMIIFVLLGFAAGIRTMLRTAAEMGKKTGSNPGTEKRND